jgi:hypothetical protein
MTFHRFKGATSALLALAITAASAMPVQAQPVPPFEINLQRLRDANSRKCANAGTYIVPTMYIYAEVRNRTSAQDKFTRAKARIYTQGLEKSGLQQLARTLYDDLVAKLRANGATVLTYDDIKAEAASFGRKSPNPKYAMPTWSDRNSTMDFLVAAPSDEQAIDWGMTGITFPYRAMAKAHNAAVIIPEITFTMPQVGASARNNVSFGVLSRDAEINVDPAMKLYGAMMNGMPSDLGWCNLQVQEHGVRLAAESVGTFEKIAEDHFQTGTGIYASTDDWNVLRTDYAFTIDQQAFRTGVLRVGYAVNGLIATTLRGK